MTSLDRLSAWYRSQCNGDWEHSFGVTIDTLDNPGWRIKIDLTGTNLEAKAFQPVERGDPNSDLSWIVCKVEAKQFVGAGGAGDLAELLESFLSWNEP